MKYKIGQPQAIHEIGGRKSQEDTICPAVGHASVSDRVFVVCDGMGGLYNGEVASETVARACWETARELLADDRPFTDDMLDAVVASAYDALDRVGKPGCPMGTTMTFLCLHKGGCLAAHIGDSRIYHLRPSLGRENGVLFRSRDHSVVQELYEQGWLSYYEMGTSPRRNVITKALQPNDEHCEASLAHITDILPGDYFYLCSDGMMEEMDDGDLMALLERDDLTDEQKARELMAATNGNADNHSAYLIYIEEVEGEPGDEELFSDEELLRKENKALNDHDKEHAWCRTMR